jgi:hypothetical protein
MVCVSAEKHTRVSARIPYIIFEMEKANMDLELK